MPSFKPTYATHKQLLPVLVLTLYSITAIVYAIKGTVLIGGQTYDFELTIKHYLAFAAIIINCVAFFMYRPYYKYIIMATVAIGALNFITFSALQQIWGIGLGSVEISFQPSAFLAGLAAYLVNRKRVNSYFSNKFGSSPQEAEQTATAYWNENVDKFKVTYANYSTEDLNQILTDNKYTAEALEAARQLVIERSGANANIN